MFVQVTWRSPLGPVIKIDTCQQPGTSPREGPTTKASSNVLTLWSERVSSQSEEASTPSGSELSAQGLLKKPTPSRRSDLCRNKDRKKTQ